MLQPYVIEPQVSFSEDYTDSTLGTQLVIKNEQYIPDEFVSTLKRDKIDTLHTPEGEFMKVCSIPTGVVEKWLTEGFDINHEHIKAIISRLNKEHLDAFITTRKRI